jgi:methionyl-tRNA formyltransferase
MAKKLSIPVLKTSNINDEKLLGEILLHKANFLISIYGNQIIKEKTLNKFKAGCVNLHPAPLPYYKGISPIFWGMSKGEKEFGITLHKIDKQIDTGEIISQENLKIRPGDTEHSIYLRLSQKGFQLILNLLNLIEKGKQPEPRKQNKNSNMGSYYSIPTKKTVKDFLKNGHKFFLIRELFLHYDHQRFVPYDNN